MNEDILALAGKLDATEITDITQENNYTTAGGKVLPPFLRIKLVSRPTDKSYIRYELWLPEKWNGIFLGTGNGGMAGIMRYEKLEHGVWWGCATAHTDMGTSDGVRRGALCRRVHEDFGWRSTYIMTVNCKYLTEQHYGKKINKSYFIGGSTGGQQALTLAQRFPEQYDGIVAGVPVTDRLHLHTYFLWSYNKLHDANGRALFVPEDIPAITAKAVEYCHIVNKVPQSENFITDSYVSWEFVDGFIDYLSHSELGLSEAQLKALEDVYKGPVDSKTGEQIYCGMPLGSESNKHGMINMLGDKCPFFFIFPWCFGEGYRESDFDFSDDMRALDAALAHDLNAMDPDLTAFFGRGGKLFMYAASADPCVPYPPTLKYFRRVIEKCGKGAVQDSMRFFIIPGQDHSAGITKYGAAVMNGDITVKNNLHIIRRWCEQGIAPHSFDVLTPNGGDTFITKRIFAVE